MVLSGMGDMNMMNDNISYMKDFKPLTDDEFAAIGKVRAILNAQNTIPCTSCRYCVDGCPSQIQIPDLFRCFNQKRRFSENNADATYASFAAKAENCVGCGQCEDVCPQKLPIRKLLQDVADAFCV